MGDFNLEWFLWYLLGVAVTIIATKIFIGLLA